MLDEVLKLVPGPETPTVNLQKLKDILLSKDLARNAEIDWADLRFLDGADSTGDRVLFASFPRTGNTMTRSYVEAVTGVYTGADMNLLYSSPMQSMGMIGEAHTGEKGSVWVTKTHFPGFGSIYKSTEHTFDKAFVITRNPIDVFASFFIFMNTGSHSMGCKENIAEAFPAEWNQFVRGFVNNFKLWHKFIRE